eukprot:g4540.t1
MLKNRLAALSALACIAAAADWGSPCASSPCLNGATCADALNGGYHCTCVQGWKGRNCEVAASIWDDHEVWTPCSQRVSEADCAKGCVWHADADAASGGECRTYFSAPAPKCTCPHFSPCRNVIDSSCVPKQDKHGWFVLAHLGRSGACAAGTVDCGGAEGTAPRPWAQSGGVRVGLMECSDPDFDPDPLAPPLCDLRGEGSPFRHTDQQVFAGATFQMVGHHEDGDCFCSAVCNDACEFGGFKCGFGEAACNDANECAPSPCKNNATCTDLVHDFKCHCTPGWSGRTCEAQARNCPAGYSGENCDYNINECKVHPATLRPCADSASASLCTIDVCQTVDKGAKCTDGENSYACNCTAGYKGAHCDKDVLDCYDSSGVPVCKNGATCKEGFNAYACSCTAGWGGTNCDEKLACDVTHCKNGGTVGGDQIDGCSCSCAAGWTGDTCDTRDDACVNHQCKNDATCTSASPGYTCTCKPGSKGQYCEQDVNKCEPNPCKNEAQCTNFKTSYTCTCKPGWQGDNCDLSQNDCIQGGSLVCKNGATCEDKHQDYECSCALGWKGKNCEQSINDCASNPCKNNAQCTDKHRDYECHCEGGWSGKNCDRNIDECKVDVNGNVCSNEADEFRCTYPTCKNGGVCTDSVNAYTCECAAGWEGANCTDSVNDCLDSHNIAKCKNGATCEDKHQDYECHCASGWKGPTCEASDNDCLPDPCQNGGTCRDNHEDYTCDCTTGWSGKTCTTDVDECVPNPCKHGGGCADSNTQDDIPKGSYACDCTDTGYEGTTCETDVNECDADPCKNGAQCEDSTTTDTVGVGNYTCTCATGWSGKDCKHKIDMCKIDINGNECEEEGDPLCKYDRCENGGKCTLTEPGAFKCACEAGWSGDTCGHQIDMCKIDINGDECAEASDVSCIYDRCGNGGKCTRSVNGFTCDCAQTGYEGFTCEESIDDCKYKKLSTTRGGFCKLDATGTC